MSGHILPLSLCTYVQACIIHTHSLYIRTSMHNTHMYTFVHCLLQKKTRGCLHAFFLSLSPYIRTSIMHNTHVNILSLLTAKKKQESVCTHFSSLSPYIRTSMHNTHMDTFVHCLLQKKKTEGCLHAFCLSLSPYIRTSMHNTHMYTFMHCLLQKKTRRTSVRILPLSPEEWADRESTRHLSPYGPIWVYNCVCVCV